MAGREGDAIIAPMQQPGGSHGYLNRDPEPIAIFIASGYSIKAGVVLEDMRNLSVAPTLARLLGIQLLKTEAPALSQILQ